MKIKYRTDAITPFGKKPYGFFKSAAGTYILYAGRYQLILVV